MAPYEASVKRSIETRSSKTAAFTCVSRACAHMEPDERLRGPDHLARVFLPPVARLAIGIPPLRRFFLKRMAPPGIYEYVLARTRLMDRFFVEALDRRCDQIVLLGAGFDTRAVRFQGQNRGTRIFEMDIRTTQEPKLRILRRKGIPLPEELVFVAVDFNRESLADALGAAGYGEGQRTFFLWEGVTMYLTPKAVDETLAFVRGSSAPGSRIAFDHIYASVLRRENRYYGEREIHRTVFKAGEAWTFGIEDGDVERFLRERGFGLISLHTAADLEASELTAGDGTLLGRVQRNPLHRPCRDPGAKPGP